MRALSFALALAVGAASTPSAQGRYMDPWDPQTEAAAEAAVARLGLTRALSIQPSVLSIQPSVLSIPALAGTLGSSAIGLVRTVQETTQALNDLHATETARDVRVDLPADVLFDFDKFDIHPEAVPSLEKVAVILRAYETSQVSIVGHTDGKGTAAYNQSLSERRAAAVRAWLDGHGLKDLRMQSRGVGATEPVVPETNKDGSDNPDGRQKNRRVSIVITKPS